MLLKQIKIIFSTQEFALKRGWAGFTFKKRLPKADLTQDHPSTQNEKDHFGQRNWQVRKHGDTRTRGCSGRLKKVAQEVAEDALVSREAASGRCKHFCLGKPLPLTPPLSGNQFCAATAPAHPFSRNRSCVHLLLLGRI